MCCLLTGYVYPQMYVHFLQRLPVLRYINLALQTSQNENYLSKETGNKTQAFIIKLVFVF